MRCDTQINPIRDNERTNIKLSESNFRNLTRQERGKLIAQKYGIIQTNKGYLVPSQFNKRKYLVTINCKTHKCNCPDHETRHCKCKHIYAVEYSITKEVDENDNVTITQTVKKTYPQNWRAYNLAQQNEKDLFMRFLSGITRRINQPAYDFGRPKNLLGDMVYSMVFKVYSGFSGRRFTTDMNISKEKGYIENMPHFNSIFNYFNNEALTPLLAQMVKVTSLPLVPVEKDFAIDSTGFGTMNFQRWFSYKHGKDICSRKWVKCHFVTGVKSNIITSVKVTTEYDNDCPEFKELVTDTAELFDMDEISGDKAYSSRENHNIAESVGATAFIPFKRNATGKSKGSFMWKKMYHYFQLNTDEFMEHYHKRSNVETSVQMLKSKFGNRVRSKKWTAQVNEVLCKVIAHNICVVIQELHELGINPDFCTKSQIPAQIV